MLHFIPYISLFGLFLPLLILFYNKGFRSVNRYIACFLFFASLYLLESFTLLYSESKNWAAFFTISRDSIFYLIGPLSFFYVRGVLRDSTQLNKKDWLHFLPFIISFTGSIPYFFSSWDFKLRVAENILSENWNTAQFDLNLFIPHKIDQVLNVLVLYFYTGSLWNLIWKYKKKSNSRIYRVPQFKLIRNWLLIFNLIMTIITINFSVTTAYILIYDNKSVFLQKASVPLLFAALFYVIINMVIMFFPHIMYGLPIERLNTIANLNENKPNFAEAETIAEHAPALEHNETRDVEDEKSVVPQLFSNEYILKIKEQLQACIEKELYLDADFRLNSILIISGIPSHHLSYYFNSVLKISFSDWRNKLRINHAIQLLHQGELKQQTLEAVALKSGFTNQTTFIRAFKLCAMKTPSQYVKDMTA